MIEPISLPHDGPIFRIYQQQQQITTTTAVAEDLQSENDWETIFSSDQQYRVRAAQILWESVTAVIATTTTTSSSPSSSIVRTPSATTNKKKNPQKDSCNDSVRKASTIQQDNEKKEQQQQQPPFLSSSCRWEEPFHLLTILSQATHLHQQLQALQMYRSRMASIKGQPQKQQQQQEKVPQCNRIHNVINFIEERNHCFVFGILLEWMLSYMTPVPLQRAIASCLMAYLNQSQDITKYNCMMDMVWDSILEDASQGLNNWKVPLHTLQEMLSWIPMQQRLQIGATKDSTNNNKNTTIPKCTSQKQLKQYNIQVSIERVLIFLQHQSTQSNTILAINGIELLAKLIDKTLLLYLQQHQQQPQPDKGNNPDGHTIVSNSVPNKKENCRVMPLVEQLYHYLWNVISNADQTNLMNVNLFSSMGMAYGRTLQIRCNNNNDNSTTSTIDLNAIRQQSLSFSHLARLSILQGILLVVPLPDATVWMQDCQHIALEATDPEIRLYALKGIRILLSRFNTVLLLAGQQQQQQLDVGTNKSSSCMDQSNETISTEHEQIRQVAHNVSQDALHVILQAWENPPTRKLASSLPPLFDCLVRVLLQLNSNFDELVKWLLAQPKHRKGRYLALETLLPITGAQMLLKASSSTTTTTTMTVCTSASTDNYVLLQDLIDTIGDRGHNTGVIAELWSKLLQKLLVEMMDESNSVVEQNPIPHQWTNIWIPVLAKALVTAELSRRRQVAAFSIPRFSAIIEPIAKTKHQKITALAFIFRDLLEHVSSSSFLNDLLEHSPKSIFSNPRESVHDRLLWVKLEIVRYICHDNLIGNFSKVTNVHGVEDLCRTVSLLLPLKCLEDALFHFSPTIRVSALQVLEPVITAYNPNLVHMFGHVQQELNLWKRFLPFAVKTNGKEYVASILQSLIEFMDRLSLVESVSVCHGSTSCDMSLPMMHSFVVDFLLGDLILKKCGYPDTVPSKEDFALALVEGVTIFAVRDHPFASNSKLFPKASPTFTRKRSTAEESTMKSITMALVGTETFGTLLSLLHSIWDNTRSTSYRMLTGLLILAQMHSLTLPLEITNLAMKKSMKFRGIFLASSPRQRESDTGARIIAFLYASEPSNLDKNNILIDLVDLLYHRLSSMKDKLADLLSGKGVLSARELPLAHGVVQAIRLALENESYMLPNCTEKSKDIFRNTLIRMAVQFISAIRISLGVVADVKDGKVVDAYNDELNCDHMAPSKNPINPGAIGANGIFSSLNRVSSIEKAKQDASQRIVIGSWLLTKETCEAVSTLLTLKRFDAEFNIVEEVGMLLISTLTSVKHTGAAFAAHRALQRISQACMQKDQTSLHFQLPLQWISRLLREISEIDKIRDSTLRRSLGYSLGFLSLMRSEVACLPSPHQLCRRVLIELIKMSLPSQRLFELFLQKVGMDKDLMRRLFTFSCSIELDEMLTDTDFALRARVHSLNVLRLVILDAPLSQEVFPVVGLAIMSAIVGYTDPEWSVRNSATMLFAAAMLRSIDSDKNATNTDITSCNAITLHELVQAYPALDSFLLAVLKGGVSGALTEQRGLMSLPPILPILLLFARVQSVASSGIQSILLAEVFIPSIIQCLQHRSINIRKAAARALENLVSYEINSVTSLSSVLEYCKHTVLLTLDEHANKNSCRKWNELHGALLTMQELITCSDKARRLARDGSLIHDLLQICRVQCGVIYIPPLCMSVALDILDILSSVSERSQLISTCHDVISWVESKSHRQADLIGLAELSSTVASIETKSLASIVWNQASFNSKQPFNRLDLLFRSKSIDIKVASVKTFKKSMKDGLPNASSSILASLAKILLSTFTNEIANNSNPENVGGPHPPTLRRISRCLVDVVESIRRVKNVNNFFIDCSSVALQILKSRQTVPTREPGSFTLLEANAVELLSFVFSADQNAQHDEWQKHFYAHICGMSDPDCHWRVRHSAAVGLERTSATSGLHFAVRDVDTCTKVAFFRSWSRLIQDDDVDVRHAASCVVTEYRDDWSRQQYLSDIVLVRDYACICNFLPKDKLFEILLEQLYDPSWNLLDKFAMAMEEFSFSECANDITSTSLANLDSTRRIFEEEDPNSYREQCLSGQLAATEITRRILTPIKALDKAVIEAIRNIFSCTESILLLLSERLPCKDMLHDLTRSNLLFPLLHNLLLGAVVSIFLIEKEDTMNCHESKNIQRLADEIIQKCEAGLEQSPTLKSSLHPAIMTTLRTIGYVKSEPIDTVAAMYDCCWLISRELN